MFCLHPNHFLSHLCSAVVSGPQIYGALCLHVALEFFTLPIIELLFGHTISTYDSPCSVIVLCNGTNFAEGNDEFYSLHTCSQLLSEAKGLFSCKSAATAAKGKTHVHTVLQNMCHI